MREKIPLPQDFAGRVDAVLESVRPAVRAHGGDIEVVAVENGVVRLKFRGACGSCALAPVTLRLGIEPLIKRSFPEITSVTAE
ncbi:MAG: NifU family protein [Patescibacteria group bacterium]